MSNRSLSFLTPFRRTEESISYFDSVRFFNEPSVRVLEYHKQQFSEKQADEENASRRIIKYIDKVHAEIILCMLAGLAEGEQEPGDGDAWELTVTYLNGAKKTVTGPMDRSEEIDGVNLSEYIRSIVAVENLAVFDKTP